MVSVWTSGVLHGKDEYMSSHGPEIDMDPFSVELMDGAFGIGKVFIAFRT